MPRWRTQRILQRASSPATTHMSRAHVSRFCTDLMRVLMILGALLGAPNSIFFFYHRKPNQKQAPRNFNNRQPQMKNPPKTGKCPFGFPLNPQKNMEDHGDYQHLAHLDGLAGSSASVVSQGQLGRGPRRGSQRGLGVLFFFFLLGGRGVFVFFFGGERRPPFGWLLRENETGRSYASIDFR